jgi:GntR family transcriptional repressor for pyruvate dehydrogenase complex
LIRNLLDTPTKGGALAEQIAEAIGRGELVPGQCLEPIEAAAERLGVSPAVVRESRQRLVTAGVLTIRWGSGAVINPSADWRSTERLGLIARRGRPEHLVEVRAYFVEEMRFEADAARRGALDPDPAAFAELERARDAFARVAGRAPSGQPLREYDVADWVFHRAIVGLGGDPAHMSLSEHAQGVLLEEALHRRRSSKDVHGDLREHRDIVEAIASRDPGAAEAATVGHLKRLAERRSRAGAWRDGAGAAQSGGTSAASASPIRSR